GRVTRSLHRVRRRVHRKPRRRPAPRAVCSGDSLAWTAVDDPLLGPRSEGKPAAARRARVVRRRPSSQGVHRSGTRPDDEAESCAAAGTAVRLRRSELKTHSCRCLGTHRGPAAPDPASITGSLKRRENSGQGPFLGTQNPELKTHLNLIAHSAGSMRSRAPYTWSVSA